uniref:Uncharacterized protein n=1 Tax=Candidatus Kentrum sp. MB TaxID=2138164 RepID=A0A450XBF0_9GAMM|nr:MAG: hypothetical protein BECKMB1821I_GA0114274_100164 [Candidatus Kentron sp. MB]VFK74523.1 MAG: hypothetical protein BECKMB1821H_GA0114242_100610 [Candidatus Kentron sp. MB]
MRLICAYSTCLRFYRVWLFMVLGRFLLRDDDGGVFSF